MKEPLVTNQKEKERLKRKIYKFLLQDPRDQEERELEEFVKRARKLHWVRIRRNLIQDVFFFAVFGAIVAVLLYKIFMG